jgi:hypothetical protein
VHFAAALPKLTWQPLDNQPEHLVSITAWTRHAGLKNVRPPLLLDVCSNAWSIERADAVVCSDMIHRAPPSATVGLLRGAARALVPRGMLFLHGPFRLFGQHTGAGNQALDRQLRHRNSEWGLRDLDSVIEFAERCGLLPVDLIAMPADSFLLILGLTGTDWPPGSGVGRNSRVG